MASNRDYYEVLGLDRNASEKDIQQAYRKLSKKYHPDLNKAPGAEQKFKEVNEAYEVLHDPQKRSRYDQFGQAGVNGQQGFNGQASGQYGDFNGFGGFSDIFNDFFGGGTSGGRVDPTGPKRGQDLDYTMTISFMDAITGKTTDITYTRSETCPTCGGNGAQKGTHPITCDKCHGTGMMTVTHQTMFGMVQQETVCDKCSGQGTIVEHPCETCHGEGVVDHKQTLEVKVPAGIDNGQQIRLSGQGEAGRNGGPYGDLYIVFRIQPSHEFVRRGTTIYTQVPISFAQAALGDEIKVKTVHGTADLNIPAGTQPSAKFTLRGQGVPYLHGNGKGDQEVTINIAIPKKLNAKQKEALVSYVKASGDNITPQEKNFFERLKDKLG